MRSNNLSLNALRAFNTAAKHLNLVRAAEELFITQGAVSRQIQNLEEQLGVKLFKRGPRGLSFTEAGDSLAEYTSRMFTDLDFVAEQLSGKRSRQTLHVAVARSFATRFLCRRVRSFCDQYPWITLYLDGHRHMADLLKGEADVAIRVGNGRWPDLIVESLGEEQLFPVCSPKLLEGNFPLKEPRDLARFTLLHYSEQPQWEMWLHGVGEQKVNSRPGILFSETAMMLEAAEAGQGIAIARSSLVVDELANGTLIRPFVSSVSDTQAYYFCCTQRASEKPMVKAFRAWLRESINNP
jgi:DNA-binding transcriptional LysR family regulator